MPKHYIPPKSVAKLQTRKTKAFLKTIPDLSVALLRKGVDNFDEAEAEELCNDFLKYMLNENVVWHKSYFARRGLTWNEVKRLCKRFPFFMKAVEISEMILEGRYVEIPFHKNTTSKHCAILLTQGLSNPWLAPKIDMAIEHKHIDFFETIGTEPIATVKDEEITESKLHGTQIEIKADVLGENGCLYSKSAEPANRKNFP